MEYEQQQPNPDDGFVNKMKESPRTVSAIIIVLIVAAAIYAFSGNEQTAEELASDVSPSAAPEASSTPAPEDKETPKTTVTPTVPVDKGTLTEASKKLPEAKVTDTAYVEVAQKGDGLTHLARRATTRYLSDHEVGYTLTNEHRIYIEDFIRKNIPKHPVRIGMEETISFELVQQAVEAAGKLTAPQLKNLTKYTSALK
ncbi:MAG TPA: hypothetical protein VJI96_01110 [Candidatus Andersenbacteria bacterium]|nr:hypothetical protein [Candidatus Andersenbacteria bacterium]